MNGSVWFYNLREVTIETELQVLCLHLLGLSQRTIRGLLGGDSSLDVEAMVQQAVLRCGRTICQQTDDDYDFDINNLGFDAIINALPKRDDECRYDSLEFAWQRNDKCEYVEREPSGDLVIKQYPTSSLSLLTGDESAECFSNIRKIFLSQEARKELLLLLPLPMGEKACWKILDELPPLKGRDGAFRLLAALAVLGYSNRPSGHKARFLQKLVLRSRMLFEQVAVANVALRNQHHDPEMVRRVAGLRENTLVLSPELTTSAEWHQNTQADVFAVNYLNTWRHNPDRFDHWSIRDRRQDADEMADAVLLMMTCTSGIFVRISLEPRLSELGQHDVQVLGPSRWISFLMRGHGGQRGKQVFEPTSLLGSDQKPSLYVTEYPRYEELRQQFRQQLRAVSKKAKR